MEWKVFGRRQVYGSPWVEVWLDDVDIPGTGRIDHHVVRYPRASTTAVVTDEAGDFLLLYRHRFITGCTRIGEPEDVSEATRVEWIPEAEVVRRLTNGEIADGPSHTALSYYPGPHRLARRP
ncbi:hypothetical protein ACFQ6N_39035 [Kitasatospora sp. NPDC056446]|uniref:hypothetical protein n=1 Tax=Kitasatospora sp. NPDC056446 TaxID=3345819 RepID=UPI0036737FC0